ncbi:MAG: hypothetical protein HRF44_09610 [Ignavibacterium sp.]|jgi:hypothetical protein
MKHQSKLFVLVAVFLLASATAPDLHAQSNRMKQKLGLHLGLVGDPFPTLTGANVNYNVTDFLRASAGYDSFSVSVTGGDLTASTFGAGVRAMLPAWNFSPVLGLSWATVSVSASGTGVIGDTGGFSASASHLYATFGIDWQTGSGFNLGAGYNYSLKSGVGGLPYVNLGWYFSL